MKVSTGEALPRWRRLADRDPDAPVELRSPFLAGQLKLPARDFLNRAFRIKPGIITNNPLY